MKPGDERFLKPAPPRELPVLDPITTAGAPEKLGTSGSAGYEVKLISDDPKVLRNAVRKGILRHLEHSAKMMAGDEGESSDDNPNDLGGGWK